MKEEEEKKECAKCPYIQSLNLWDPWGEKGEFAIFEELKYKWGLPCTFGFFLEAIQIYQTMISEKMGKKLEEEEMLLFQYFYALAQGELRASMLLAMCGHLKSACSLLRSALETIVLGFFLEVYGEEFKEKGLKDISAFIERGFFTSPEGKKIVNFHSILEYMKEKGYLQRYLEKYIFSEAEKVRGKKADEYIAGIENLYKELSKFVHGKLDFNADYILSAPFLKEWGDDYYEKSFPTWLNFFQRTCAYFFLFLLPFLCDEGLTSHEDFLEYPEHVRFLKEECPKLLNKEKDELIRTPIIEDIAKLYCMVMRKVNTQAQPKLMVSQ